MALVFIGVDPETGNDHSPTVWVDPDSGDIFIQGWELGADLLAALAAVPAPGHVPGIPAGEAAIRIPARMAPALRKACDAAELAAVR